jgi:hypothetical protein
MIMHSNSRFDNSNHHYILSTKPYLHYVMVASTLISERTESKLPILCFIYIYIYMNEYFPNAAIFSHKIIWKLLYLFYFFKFFSSLVKKRVFLILNSWTTPTTHKSQPEKCHSRTPQHLNHQKTIRISSRSACSELYSACNFCTSQ